MKKTKIWILICTVLVGLTAIFGGVYAKYVHDKNLENEVHLKNFYFTTDLMHNKYEDLNDSSSNELTIPIYGTVEDENRLSFKVINYYDSLRINEEVINFEVTLKVTQYNDDESTTDVTANYELIDSGAPYSLEKGVSDEEVFKVNAKSGFEKVNYKTNVKVLIESQKPYKKKLEINYDLYPEAKGVDCKISDATSVMYAQLIIENNEDNITSEATFRVELDVLKEGKIYYDQSNKNVKAIYGNNLSSFPTSLEINVNINQDGSFSLILFKKDITKDYSSIELVCSKTTEDGKTVYVITEKD